MPTYLKYEYIFSSFRFKVGSGSAFFPSRIQIRGKKCRIRIPVHRKALCIHNLSSTMYEYLKGTCVSPCSAIMYTAVVTDFSPPDCVPFDSSWNVSSFLNRRCKGRGGQGYIILTLIYNTYFTKMATKIKQKIINWIKPNKTRKGGAQARIKIGSGSQSMLLFTMHPLYQLDMGC